MSTSAHHSRGAMRVGLLGHVLPGGPVLDEKAGKGWSLDQRSTLNQVFSPVIAFILNSAFNALISQPAESKETDPQPVASFSPLETVVLEMIRLNEEDNEYNEQHQHQLRALVAAFEDLIGGEVTGYFLGSGKQMNLFVTTDLVEIIMEPTTFENEEDSDDERRIPIEVMHIKDIDTHIRLQQDEDYSNFFGLEDEARRLEIAVSSYEAAVCLSLLGRLKRLMESPENVQDEALRLLTLLAEEDDPLLEPAYSEKPPTKIEAYYKSVQIEPAAFSKLCNDIDPSRGLAGVFAACEGSRVLFKANLLLHTTIKASRLLHRSGSFPSTSKPSDELKADSSREGELEADRKMREDEFTEPAARVTRRFVESLNQRTAYVQFDNRTTNNVVMHRKVVKLFNKYRIKGTHVELMEGSDDIVLISFKFDFQFDKVANEFRCQYPAEELPWLIMKFLQESVSSALLTPEGRRHYPLLTPPTLGDVRKLATVVAVGKSSTVVVLGVNRVVGGLALSGMYNLPIGVESSNGRNFGTIASLGWVVGSILGGLILCGVCGLSGSFINEIILRPGSIETSNPSQAVNVEGGDVGTVVVTRGSYGLALAGAVIIGSVGFVALQVKGKPERFFGPAREAFRQVAVIDFDDSDSEAEAVDLDRNIPLASVLDRIEGTSRENRERIDLFRNKLRRIKPQLNDEYCQLLIDHIEMVSLCGLLDENIIKPIIIRHMGDQNWVFHRYVRPLRAARSRRIAFESLVCLRVKLIFMIHRFDHTARAYRKARRQLKRRLFILEKMREFDERVRPICEVALTVIQILERRREIAKNPGAAGRIREAVNAYGMLCAGRAMYGVLRDIFLGIR